MVYKNHAHCRKKIEKLDAEKYDKVYVDITTERNRKLTFGTVYRPPKLQAADDTALYEEINSITQNKAALIIGDFNCSNIDLNLMHGDQEGNRLFEMVEDSFLTQLTNPQGNTISSIWYWLLTLI